MKKKVIALLLAVTMAFGLTACGSESESNNGGDKTATDQGSENTGSDDNAEPATD